MKTLLLSLLVSTSAFAGVEWECVYQRSLEGVAKPERHRFLLMQGYAEKEASFRNHGYKAKVVGDAFTVEVAEGKSAKVASVSLKDAWGAKRDPKIPSADFDFPGVKVAVKCR